MACGTLNLEDGSWYCFEWGLFENYWYARLQNKLFVGSINWRTWPRPIDVWVYHIDASYTALEPLSANISMFLQDTFSLGKWDRSTVTGEGEYLIRPSEHGAEGEGGTIVLEVRRFVCRGGAGVAVSA